MNDNERRLKVVRIPENDVLSFLNWRHQFGECEFCSFPVIEGVPDGYKVIGVQHDWSYQAFSFLISHPSFELVPPCAMVPVIDAWSGKRDVIRVERDEHGLVYKPRQLLAMAKESTPGTAIDFENSVATNTYITKVCEAVQKKREAATQSPAKRGWEFLGAP